MLKFEKFSKEYFEEYKSWFKDENIKNALYNVDDEWLDFVLNDPSGIDYVIFLGEEMVAVVGLVFPNAKHLFYGINNIAILPSKFRQGLGSTILKNLFKLHPLKEQEYWVSFVEKKNLAAQHFFEKNGWNRKEEVDMIRYEMSNV